MHSWLRPLCGGAALYTHIRIRILQLNIRVIVRIYSYLYAMIILSHFNSSDLRVRFVKLSFIPSHLQNLGIDPFDNHNSITGCVECVCVSDPSCI